MDHFVRTFLSHLKVRAIKTHERRIVVVVYYDPPLKCPKKR